MSLYSDPKFYRKSHQCLDLAAPMEVSNKITDLDHAFKSLFQAQSYDQLDILRESKEPAFHLTDNDTKFSAEMFAHYISQLGYPEEAASVLSFLKGIGEYDLQQKKHFFTIR